MALQRYLKFTAKDAKDAKEDLALSVLIRVISGEVLSLSDEVLIFAFQITDYQLQMNHLAKGISHIQSFVGCAAAKACRNHLRRSRYFSVCWY